MTRLAIEGEPSFAVSLADAPKRWRGRRPNYTVETLEGLCATLAPGSSAFSA